MTEPVVVDIEATIKAEVAKAIAAAKAAESTLATKVKAFATAHYSKVIAVIGGWLTAHFGLIEAAFKLI
jgi:hypothetical protein